MLTYKFKSKVKEHVRIAARIMSAHLSGVVEKGEASNIVTSADIEIQHYLQAELSKLLPGSGFYCEEENVAFFKEYTWLIDPIDGTMNFFRGMPGCVISVALLKDKTPVFGVVYCPAMKLMYEAALGKGAYLNRRRIHVSDKDFRSSLLCSAMSLYNKHYAGICKDIIYDAYLKCNDIRRIGSCALELCYIAEGKCDLFFEIRVHPWDYAAAYLILKEAGGVLTGADGDNPGFDGPTALVGANSEKNHAELKEIVKKHMKTVPY